AVGNIAGTNILNILFILGLSAAIRPLSLQLRSIRFDVPVMIATSVVLILMAMDGVLSRLEGIILVVAAVFYVITIIRVSRRESAKVKKEFAEEYSPNVLLKQSGPLTWVINTVLLFVGMGMT